MDDAGRAKAEEAACVCERGRRGERARGSLRGERGGGGGRRRGRAKHGRLITHVKAAAAAKTRRLPGYRSEPAFFLPC